jgi:hypothetical protein
VTDLLARGEGCPADFDRLALRPLLRVRVHAPRQVPIGRVTDVSGHRTMNESDGL